MTEYEVQAIAVARATLTAYWVADIIAGCALLVVIVGGVVAYRTLNAGRWNSLLSFEQDMASRRTKFTEVATQLNSGSTFATELYLEAKESYFNSLDRLASSILNGHFPDREMKQDYQDAITNVVRHFPDDFGTGTHFRKVVKLYNRWQDGD